ncbi:MAG: hypothetical protein J7L73_06380 [Anaerolineales bacterium]|nr:hypothetical protein [Anaerolineales bacterium]
MSKGKSKWIPNVFDEYTFKARYIPSIIIAIPIMVLSSLVNADEFNELFRYADKFLIVSTVGLNAIFIIFLTHVVRTMGKYLIEYFLFCDGLKFPTTEMLLWKTKLISKEKKANLHAKIQTDFAINLASLEGETNDEHEARLLAKDAVDQIRNQVGDGRNTKQYNIYYGLFRNLTGGLPLAIIMAVLSLFFVDGNLAKVIGWAYLVSMCIYTFLAIPLLKAMGKHYAQYLFTEYLEKESQNA